MTDAASSRTPDLDVLATLQAEFLASIPLTAPETPVPWCGRWRVRHLVVHLARVHHWAAAQARRAREVPLGRGPFDLVDVYSSCAQELLTTLRELDPVARAATLLDDGVPRAEQTGTVAFWHRRQKLETLVHLWDLRTAGGLPPGPVLEDEALWWDAVAEVAEVMHPRQVRLGRTGPPAVLLTLEGPDGEITLDGGLAPVAGTPVARVTGSAQDLALLLWGRRDLDHPGLEVDRAARPAVVDLLASGLTP